MQRKSLRPAQVLGLALEGRHLLFRVLARADYITNISERRFLIRAPSSSPPRARRGRSIILQNR
jgi:hypothetical protein